MDISIVISLLNEEESLVELHDWIKRVMEEQHYSYEILFIDDGSTDSSWSIIEQLRLGNPCVKGIKFRRNYGKSAALNVGFTAAEGNVVITMDADLQDSPDEIPGLYKMVSEEGYHLVSGWKKKRYDSTLMKNIPSKIYNATTRRVTGVKLHDMNCGLKAYRREVIKSIEVYGEMHRYIPAIAKWAGFKKIGEKVVVHRPRPYGTSKFGMERFIYGFLDLMSISFVARFGKRPMHIFGTLGTLLFAIGFFIAAYLAYGKFFMAGYRMTERPLFYFGLLAMILGTQLFVSGFLAELISRSSADRNKYLIEKTEGISSHL
jgi:glycosyltransferase involved in cell wall biosynthesis